MTRWLPAACVLAALVVTACGDPPNKEMDLGWNLEGLETRVSFSKDKAGKTTGGRVGFEQ